MTALLSLGIWAAVMALWVSLGALSVIIAGRCVGWEIDRVDVRLALIAGPLGFVFVLGMLLVDVLARAGNVFSPIVTWILSQSKRKETRP